MWVLARRKPEPETTMLTTLTLALAAFTATCLMIAGLPLLGTAMLVSAGVTAAAGGLTDDDAE
jgi:hypothetical protein